MQAAQAAEPPGSGTGSLGERSWGLAILPTSYSDKGLGTYVALIWPQTSKRKKKNLKELDLTPQV